MKGTVRKRGKTWSYSFNAGKVPRTDKGGHPVYDDDGNPVYKWNRIDCGGFSTKKEAEEALTEALAKYMHSGQATSQSKITVSEYLDLWFDQYCRMNSRYNTQVSRLSVIENRLKPVFGHFRLQTLSPAAVQEWVNSLKVEGYARETVRHYLGVLSAAMEYAVEPLRYVEFNPCSRVRIPKYEDGRQETHIFLPKEGLRKITDRFPESSPFYVPIMIGYHAGLRISECFALTWDRVDLDRRVIRVDRQAIKRNFGDVRQSINKGRQKMEKSVWYLDSPKTSTSVREIRFGPTLERILRRAKRAKQENRISYGAYFIEHYLQPETAENGDTLQKIVPVSRSIPVSLPAADLICVRADGSMLTSDSFKYVCRVCRHELGIPFNYHSLRHTHATMLIEGGADVKDVQERLGHADIQTTMNRYVHDTEIMKERTVEIFEGMII